MARRSVLFSPADRPEMLRKAPDYGADVIAFDLEDAVAPQRKDEARTAVREVLSSPQFDPACEVCVRVNQVGIEADDDLEALDPELRLDSLMLPKVASRDDVETFVQMLDEHDLVVPVIALIETAAGVLAAAEIADADPVVALVFGAEDLAADLGATRTEEGTEVIHAREHVVLAAAAADVEAIDTVFVDYEDTGGLRDETNRAIQLGFDGKLAIHPAQVSPINETFTPDEGSIEWARAVLSGRDRAAEEGRAVFSVDGEMIDAPLIARAERIADRARAAGVY